VQREAYQIFVEPPHPLAVSDCLSTSGQVAGSGRSGGSFRKGNRISSPDAYHYKPLGIREKRFFSEHMTLNRKFIGRREN
jgi:hypothetical protein